MISGFSKNPVFMQEQIQKLTLTQGIQVLQQYILILFCRKSIGKTNHLQKKKNGITALFLEKEFMQNMLSDLLNASIFCQNVIVIAERGFLYVFLCLQVSVNMICLLNFARGLIIPV